jgi:5-(carboxyamino)imidazole ribonucleotide synthase
VILPGSTVGVLGGGQLGRMLAMEGRRMGYRVVVLDPGANGPAAQLADEHIRAPLDNRDAALDLARRSDVVTLEWENASVDIVEAMTGITPVRPGAGVLRVAQDRVEEKSAARRLGLATAGFRAVRSRSDLQTGLAGIGAPAILKTARGGYDGKGQARIDSVEDADRAYEELAGSRGGLILEERIDFRMEVSVICARTPAGEMAVFPIAENTHSRGILDVTVVPARLEPETLKEARRIGETLTEGLGVVGLLTVELFVTADHRLLVNEIAPRPHNSGHYTWDACSVSQFEQQLRAVCGLPLEDPVLLRPAAMANLLGEHIVHGMAAAGDMLSTPMTALHLYGKSEGRPGRKMGHITAMGEDVEQARDRAVAARDLLAGHGPRNPAA